MDLQAIQYYCAYQERCHSEVRSKLLELGFRGDELEEAIASLIADNFLNEERYAQQYCGGKFRINKWGRKKIIQELKKKKVSDFCIKKGLKEIDAQEYWETLQQLTKKKMSEINSKEKNIWIRKQKLQRYLIQKGYESDLINDVMKEA
ncbi:RecX family transcriptional regulator [Taibaiella lutea]|uniref:Regulatory protein RecX n=1 Tax=Taibaiella lutea TaxID=2608001 RepID=A0A5M6CDT0_9BACT|nr:regulatory protein RecX [Taibaiella lutea]KAA5533133.1 RecX family transcriptional regulator [Taibaiella lutea]